MAEETSSPQKKARLNSVMNDHPIFGNTLKSLPSKRFPSMLQVFNHVRYLKGEFSHRLPPHVKGVDARKEELRIYRGVADQLIETFKSGYVLPVMEKESIVKQVEKLVKEKTDHVQKNKHRLLNNPEKKNAFLSEMGRIVNICNCSCFLDKTSKEEIIGSNCSCPPENKVMNLDCFGNQILGLQEIIIFEEEKQHFEKILADQKEASPATTTSALSPDDNSESVSENNLEFNRPRPKSFAPLLELGDNDEDMKIEKGKIALDNTLETCLALGLKPAGIMKILNTFVTDNNLPSYLLVSEQTLRRRIDELYAKNSEIHSENNKGLVAIGYDERQDFTLQPNGSMKKEDHITITDGFKYIAHDELVVDPLFPKITKGSAINKTKSIKKVIVKSESLDVLIYLFCDGTNTNTGYKGIKNIYVDIYNFNSLVTNDQF